MTNAPNLPGSERLDEFACYRTDNRNLMDQWLSDKQMRNVKSHTLRSTSDLLELDTARTEYALGMILFLKFLLVLSKY